MNETAEQLEKRAAFWRQTAAAESAERDRSELAHAVRVARRWEARAQSLREVIELIDLDRAEMSAPEDDHVAALCEMYGYGAVMDAAARLWAREDPNGALTVGPCRITVRHALESRHDG